MLFIQHVSYAGYLSHRNLFILDVFRLNVVPLNLRSNYANAKIGRFRVVDTEQWADSAPLWLGSK